MKETMRIVGMSCGGCVSAIEWVLTRLPQTTAKVDIGQVEVEYDELRVTHEQIVGLIRSIGYEVMEPVAHDSAWPDRSSIQPIV